MTTDEAKSDVQTHEELNELRRCHIEHPVFEETREAVLRSWKSARPLTVVVGGTGVGKSTLAKYMHEKLLQSDMGSSTHPTKSIISLYIPTRPGLKELFSWPAMLRRILEEASEIDVEGKMNFDARMRFSKSRNRWQPDADSLAEAVRSMLVRRGNKSTSLDEGQYLARGASRAVRTHRTEILKDFVDSNRNTRFNVYGSFETLDLRDLNGQLARRIIWIQLRRYLHNQADCDVLNDILHTLLLHVPLKVTFNPGRSLNKIYPLCFGSFGLLRDTLVDASQACVDAGKSVLTLDDLRKAALPPADRATIAKEFINGEARFAEAETEMIDAMMKEH